MMAPPDYNGMPVSAIDGDAKQRQERFWRYCHDEGLARFSVSFVADAASRVDLRAEAYVPGVGWVQDFDIPEASKVKGDAPKVNQIVDQLRGKYTTLEQTVWQIVWHKRSAGELYLVSEDDDDLGVTYTPYGYKAVEKRKDGYKISDRPGAKVGGGARIVSFDSVARIWTPDPDFPLEPYSALWAGLKDLDRYTALGKVIDRSANSALLNKGMMWFPGEAMDDMVPVGNQQMPRLARDYYVAQAMSLEGKSDSDVSAVAPLAVWWDSDFGAPQMIKFGMPMETTWFDMRSAVVADFARTVDLPSVMVINGGAGGASGGDGASSNHWSDLLVDRRTFDMTIGRDLDTVTHEDLTRHFLKGQLRAANIEGDWRVGYDPTKLIVNQDRSIFALDSLRIGLISYKATAKRLGFRPDEMATEDDIKRLAALVTRSAQADGSTRFRRRQEMTDMGGAGTSSVLPMTASALRGMDARQLYELAVRTEMSEDGILWMADA